MFDHISLLPLAGIFLAAAGAIWVAGIYVSDTTAVLSKRIGLGEALGGIIVLAIVTNLPEIAIAVSAAQGGQVDLAVGNILGGIAIQTVVLVVLDAFGVGRADTLTRKATSLVPVLEAGLVIAVLAVSVLGSQLPKSLVVAGITPAGGLILVLWVAGVWLIGRANKDLPWEKKKATDDHPKTFQNHSRNQGRPAKTTAGAEPAKPAHSTRRVALMFGAAAAVTLVAGVLLERSGEALATQLGMGGAVFGATVLAAATALPEVSTGLAAIKQQNYELAIGDIFGGNAFLPVLLLVAGVVSGKAVLPLASKLDVYLTGLGMLLTSVYLYGLIMRPKKQVAGMGLDSLIVLVLYGLGVLGVLAIGNR
ncbi:MAG: sodium:calcium antiporter [Bacteroidota bacterium]|nr:sodium:calcium antiporter [Bacteroidota bacterium]